MVYSLVSTLSMPSVEGVSSGMNLSWMDGLVRAGAFDMKGFVAEKGFTLGWVCRCTQYWLFLSYLLV